MPNHVTNILLMSPEVADAITRGWTAEEVTEAKKDYAATCARYKERTGDDWPYPERDYSERIVDFALVVPEPDNMFHGGCNGQHPHVDDNGVVLECWYSWNSNNWGTKWNAYDYEVTAQPGDLCQVKFDTAWAHPEPVVRRLAAKFPDEEIQVVFADEDLGSNVGRYKIKGALTYDEYFPEYGDESCEMAAQIKYGKSYAELRAEWDDEDESA